MPETNPKEDLHDTVCRPRQEAEGLAELERIRYLTSITQEDT